MKEQCTELQFLCDGFQQKNIIGNICFFGVSSCQAVSFLLGFLSLVPVVCQEKIWYNEVPLSLFPLQDELYPQADVLCWAIFPLDCVSFGAQINNKEIGSWLFFLDTTIAIDNEHYFAALITYSLLFFLVKRLKGAWWRLWRSWMTTWELPCRRRLMQTALKRRKCLNASFWMEMTCHLLTATFCPNSTLSR